MSAPQEIAPGPPRRQSWPPLGAIAIACLLLLESGGTAFTVLPLFARHDLRAVPAGLAALLLFLGGAGLLRLRRWGWALAMAASMLTACGWLYLALARHTLGPLVPALLFTVFFLYLMRPELRRRMR